MVLVITDENLPEPFSDIGGAMVLPALKLGLNGFELRCHPLCRRYAPDIEGSAASEMTTIMCESQKHEGLRLSFTTLFSASSSEPAELDPSRLIRI